MNVKQPLEQLDKLLENRVRLAIMSVLAVSESVDFTSLKSMLDVTDGNLAAHVAVLERAKYIRVSKSFVDRKPLTRYMITEGGRKAFKKHVDALERLIRGGK
ncbi:MAG: transcriptional regulator [Bacteroidota bacterium]